MNLRKNIKEELGLLTEQSCPHPNGGGTTCTIFRVTMSPCSSVAAGTTLW